MADVVITIVTPLPASVAFSRLVDWERHTAAIPLTTLSYEGDAHAGQTFVARTALGPVGFDDVMRVELLRPPAGDQPGDVPGLVEVSKHGRVLGGSVRWTVAPVTGGSRIEWVQRLVVPWLPRVADPIVAAIGRRAYGTGLRRILGS
ncbi:MAG TPA: hypothetical protein VFK68_08930 [Propionibacteriaceae bacterium]|nr:hypothetical protein [Propionibacteriaceae bacterium]